MTLTKEPPSKHLASMPVYEPVYEPVAYDKRIELDEDGMYVPTVRTDADEVKLPRQMFLRRAQQILEMFRPDVWEGIDVGWSFNCYPDARYMNA